MDFLEELEWRGLVKDVTDYEGLKEKLKQPVVCYCGFDPTADSLHVGHFQQIMLLRRYQLAGHTPIALCGGFTGMIGDPRPTSERSLLTLEQVTHNADCLKAQLSKFLSFEGNNAAIMENNYHWLSNLSFMDFLREYGKLFNVSYMINKDTIRKRLESGISYTEFTYTILQAIDWLNLYRKYNCTLQIGGSDQWGNLTSGIELIRKVEGENAKVFGITSPLITKSDGTKFGKSEGKNIWLDPNKTGAYEFYQFWVNIADTDIIDYLKRLSMKTPEEIMALEAKMTEAPEKREAQHALADELTMMVHGQEGLKQAQKITRVLFGGDFNELNPEEIKIALKDAVHTPIKEGSELIDALIACKACSSRREVKQLLQNGILVNGNKVTDEHFILHKEDAYEHSFTVLRKGKKNYFILSFED